MAMILNSVSVVPLTSHIIHHHHSKPPKSSILSFSNRRPASISISNGFFKPGFGSSSSSAGGGGGGGGTNVLERPLFDQSQFEPLTQVQQGGDIGRVKDKKYTGSGDSYRLLLIDDTRHTEKLVVKALPQAVPAVTPDDARKFFNISRENGLAVVLVTVKEHAEFYAQMMTRKGLRSTIEPDSTTV